MVMLAFQIQDGWSPGEKIKKDEDETSCMSSELYY